MAAVAIAACRGAERRPDAFVTYAYDAATLAPRDSLLYSGEGWGLTADGRSLIMSDGSDSPRILSPTTFQVERVVHVRYNGAPLYQLNELEFMNGDGRWCSKCGYDADHPADVERFARFDRGVRDRDARRTSQVA